MKRVKSAFLGLVFMTAASSTYADWRFGAETGALYESNLSNSDRASDVESDWAWQGEARAFNGFQLARDLRLNFGADFRGVAWSQYDAFDRIGAGISTNLRYRFGLGRLAPWLLLDERIGYDHFQQSAQSRWDETAALHGGIFLNDRVALEAGYTFENLASTGDFFDRQGHRLDAAMIFDLTSSLQVKVGYSYRNGGVISYAVPPRPDIFRIATVRVGDTAFGSYPLYNAYRFRAETHAAAVTVGYTLTKYLSAQAGYEYSVTVHDPLSYENHRFEAKIVFAY
jgi:hypothetical protein